MAKVFLLNLLGAYFFANGWQMVSLRWLALFRDFERARTTNWGQVCLAHFYSSLDTLSRGTLCLEISFFLFSLVAHAFSFLWSYIHMLSRLRLCTIFLQIVFIPTTSCKLSSCKLSYLNLTNCSITSCKLSYLNLANCRLVNCTISSCKQYHILLQTVISFQHWVMEYDLIAQGTLVDLKSVTSIRAHHNWLSPNDVSQEYIAFHYLMLLGILFLTPCVITDYVESLGRC